MTARQLKKVVNEQMDNPWILGCLACNLCRDDVVEQRHHDGRKLGIVWTNKGPYWRCTIFVDEDSELCLAQIDVHTDSTVRVEAWEACGVTVSHKNGLLRLDRLTNEPVFDHDRRRRN